MKVLIIGFGSIARKHVNALLSIDPATKFVALRNSKDSLPVEGIISVYDTAGMQELGPYSFVIISNPTSLHAAAIEIALSLQCPLFIEKPVFHTLDSLDTVQKTEQAGVQTYVACNLRFHNSLLFFRNNILPGLLVNEVNVYCGSYLPDWRPGRNFRTGYSANNSMGGGVHLDLIHELDYVYWCFGKPVDVRSVKKGQSDLGISAIDYANYLLDYEKYMVNIVLNYFRRDKKRILEVVAANDTYNIDIFTNTVTSLSDNSVLFSSEQTIADTYRPQMEYFLSRIQKPRDSAKPMMNNIREAFEVLNICLQ